MAELREYQRLFSEHDVEGLIALGAPRDEYDNEAREVAQKLEDLKFEGKRIDLASVFNVLLGVWCRSFNLEDAELELRREQLTKLALKVEALCVM